MTDFDNKIWKVGFGLIIPVDLQVTDGGLGGYFNAGLSFADLDEATALTFNIGYTGTETTAKQFPDADTETAGTFTLNDTYRFGIEVGFEDRKPSTNDKGDIISAWRSGKYSGLSFGQLAETTPGNEIFEIEENSETKNILTLTKKQNESWEIKLAETYHLVLEAGIIFSATYMFGGKENLAERPFSVQGFQIYVGISIETGIASNKATWDTEMTDVQVITYITGQVLDTIYSYIIYDGFSSAQAATSDAVSELFPESGVSGGNMWQIPFLQGITTFLGADQKPVLFYEHTSGLTSKLIVGVEVLKGFGYTLAGIGGEAKDMSLLSSGFTAINNLLTIAAEQLGVERESIYLVPLLLGALEVFSSGLFESGVFLLTAGTSTATGWAGKPGNPKNGSDNIVESSDICYMFHRFWDKRNGTSGSIATRNHLEGNIITETEIGSPVLTGSNISNFTLNSTLNDRDEETQYGSNISRPTYIRAGIGLEYDIPFDDNEKIGLNIASTIGPFTLFDSVSTTGGIAANASIALFFNIDEEDDTSFIIGGGVMGYKTYEGEGASAYGFIGIRGF